MKLNCPYCGETVLYDRSLAGRSVQCSYCQHAVHMPAVDELPEEMREELRREEARRQEQEKRRYLRRQRRYLKEVEKEEKLKRDHQARQEREELQQEVQAAQQPVPEELAVGKRYRALRALVKWNRVLAALILLMYMGYVLRDIVSAATGHTPWPSVLVVALWLAIPTLLTTVVIWASGEMLQVFLDIADDVRITRLLTKRQVYRKDDSPQ